MFVITCLCVRNQHMLFVHAEARAGFKGIHQQHRQILQQRGANKCTFVGSLISAANLPQGRCLTPLYLTAPLALAPPLTALEAAPLPGLLIPEDAECILCMWLRLGDLPLSGFLS